MIVIAGSFRLDDGVTDEVMEACKTVMQATHQEEGATSTSSTPIHLITKSSEYLRCGKMIKHCRIISGLLT